MYDVDTLFIISSARGEYPLADLLAGIEFGCPSGSHFTVVVDESGTLDTLPGTEGKFQILRSDLPEGTAAGFHRAAGLRWAIEQGMAYRQVIMLSDTCLICAQPVDAFFLDQTQKDQIGMIGVRDRTNRDQDWRNAATMLFELKVPTDAWERQPVNVVDDVLILAGRFVAVMHQKGLLVPTNCETWPSTYGAYVSWVCQMMGFYLVSWGYMDKSLPPLYVNKAHGNFLPAPQLLNQMLIYSDVTKVLSYSEGDIRELFKANRGERGREIAKLSPVVTGPEMGDVAAGGAPQPEGTPAATAPATTPVPSPPAQ